MAGQGQGQGLQPVAHLHAGEGGLQQVVHLAVGQEVSARQLLLGSLAGLPLRLLVEDVALADPLHLLAAPHGGQHGDGQQLPQVHGGRGAAGRGLGPAGRRLAQHEEGEAAGQEAGVEVVEDAEPQQAEHGHAERRQADPHGRHGRRGGGAGAGAEQRALSAAPWLRSLRSAGPAGSAPRRAGGARLYPGQAEAGRR